MGGRGRGKRRRASGNNIRVICIFWQYNVSPNDLKFSLLINLTTGYPRMPHDGRE